MPPKSTAPERAAGAPAAERELRTQGRRTMAKLLDAAMQVFQERGYHAARVDDIVRIAETSHGTFYLYFANKEDLFRALALECAAEMEELATHIGPITRDRAGWEELRHWVEGFYRTHHKYGAVIRAWMEEHVAEPALLEAGIEAFGRIVDALVQRLDASDVSHLSDHGHAAVALLAMMERFTYYVTSRNLGFDEEPMLDSLTTIIHRGFFGAPSQG